VRNQGEAGVDCGGPCVSCEIKELSPLGSPSSVKVFETNGRAVFLAEVQNPNAGFVARPFTYAFTVYGDGDRVLETLTGSASIYVSERRPLYEAGSKVSPGLIRRIGISFSDPVWEPLGKYLKPQISASDISTTAENGAVNVSGTVKNQSALQLARITVIAVLYDSFGDVLFASQTVQSLDALEERKFTVFFPGDSEIAKNVYSSSTEVFVNAD
jgi:hypothetical protein